MTTRSGSSYDVDTDVLRAMASKARRTVDGVSASTAAAPRELGHAWMVTAASGFGSAWSDGLAARVADTEDFAERLNTTARVFDEGTDAAKAEIDAMIWDG